MSASPGNSGREPGAVPVDHERAALAAADARQDAAADAERDAQAARVGAEARAEQIHVEVARTDVRRAEDEVSQAAAAVEEAERRQHQAETTESEARRHEADARRDAEEAVHRAETSVTTGSPWAARARGLGEGGTGEPIVFGPFTAERPELLVAAGFVAGFVLAKIVRKWAS